VSLTYQRDFLAQRSASEDVSRLDRHSDLPTGLAIVCAGKEKGVAIGVDPELISTKDMCLLASRYDCPY